MICIGEAHLYAIHGTFRDLIRINERDFFSRIYGGTQEYTPLFLSMSATMPNAILESLKALTHVDSTRPQHHIWSSPAEFQHRYIDMDLHVKTTVGVVGIAPLVDMLERRYKSDNPPHACIFVNFKS